MHVTSINAKVSDNMSFHYASKLKVLLARDNPQNCSEVT